MITYILLILTLIFCLLYIYYSYIHSKNEFDKIYSQLSENLIILNKLDKFVKNKTKEINEDIEYFQTKQIDQQELNKFHDQQLGQIDVALINLIDVPYIENELSPGYAKEWTGEVPYKINELFVGAKLKMTNGYVYTIDNIDGKSVSISKKK